MWPCLRSSRGQIWPHCIISFSHQLTVGWKNSVSPNHQFRKWAIAICSHKQAFCNIQISCCLWLLCLFQAYTTVFSHLPRFTKVSCQAFSIWFFHSVTSGSCFKLPNHTPSLQKLRNWHRHAGFLWFSDGPRKSDWGKANKNFHNDRFSKLVFPL